jgi:peptidoglycan/xylan/chitin deacetylase (PgdA/CDA1 family)
MKLFKTPRFLRYAYSRRTWGFSSSNTAFIHLTFDDGPNPEITPFVLDQLAIYNQKATFFCVGENAKRYPELLARIRNEGHQLGNHTMRHENANRVSSRQYLDSIAEAATVIPSNLFRPPYGRLSPRLARQISKKYRILMWSWLSYDFDSSVSVTEILEQAKKIQPGDILVLHDNAKLSEKQRELLPKLLAFLREEGLESVVF